MFGQLMLKIGIPCCVTLILKGVAVFAQTPIGPEWWPSPYGPEDQRGAINLVTPEKVIEASQLIREGKVYQLGQIYEHGMPLVQRRHFSLTIPGLPTYPSAGFDNGFVANDELISAEIGQVGTQLDGLGHIGVHHNGRNLFYNGFDLAEFGDSYGLKKLGVEKVGSFFTRGILLDVARARGVERLPLDYAITPTDLARALQLIGTDIRTGDVVLIHTGHAQLWMKDNDAYGESEPGITLESARWLTERKICLLGMDNWGIDVGPPVDPKRPFPVHHWNLVRHGIYHLENLKLSELAADEVYEFAFVFSPLKLKGATGSPGNPIAVR